MTVPSDQDRSAEVARRARVRGRVQGVWFRASTAEQAAAHSVRGHARNLPDGSVEVLAVGRAASVDALLEWLWQGPPMARVDAVDVEELDATTLGVVSGFATR